MSALTIVVDVAATTGGEFLLTGFRDVFAYVNGVKTDQWEGVAYSVVLPKVAYNALTVKVIGKPAQIQAPQQGEVIPVRFVLFCAQIPGFHPQVFACFLFPVPLLSAFQHHFLLSFFSLFDPVHSVNTNNVRRAGHIFWGYSAALCGAGH